MDLEGQINQLLSSHENISVIVLSNLLKEKL